MREIFVVLFSMLLLIKVGAQNADNFGFYGYLRSGFGVDGEGGPQDVFKAPNSEAKYRLGNEAEAYVETLFRYTIEDENEAKFETNLKLAFVTPTSKSNDFITTTSVREAYVRASGLVKKNKNLAFWAGQRFYDRYDAHMIDFWYRDMSGFGGGIEGINFFNKAQISLAWLGGSIDQLTSNGLVQPENEFSLNKTTIDFSIHHIDIGFGTLGLTFDWSVFKGDSIILETSKYLISSSNGWSIGAFHQLDFKKGRNIINVFYGTGAAENYKAVITQPLGMNILPNEMINIQNVNRFRALNDFLINFNPKFSLMGLVLYQALDNGQEMNNHLDWLSLGMRPAFHFSKYFSIVAELGYDYTRQSGIEEGALFKVTLAPQLSPLNEILSRPAVRAFVTYAYWTDSYIGEVASFSFPNQNNGFSFGLQMEAWW